MSVSSWQSELQQAICIPRSNNHQPVVFVGVGRVENGDDGAGITIINRLMSVCKDSEKSLFINGGAAPENLLGVITRSQPRLVVFIDAAQMDREPGCVQVIPIEMIGGLTAVTHGLSFGIIGRYLQDEVGCRVMVLGIQPQSNQPNTTLSRVISDVVQQVSDSLEALVRDEERGKYIFS